MLNCQREHPRQDQKASSSGVVTRSPAIALLARSRLKAEFYRFYIVAVEEILPC